MQDAVLKMKEIGPPPEGFEDGGADPTEETLALWERWQDALERIQRPVTWEEAEILIRCCPLDYMAGLEWTLLHCIESCCSWKDTPDIPRFRALLEKCNSPLMQGMLRERLDNYVKLHGSE